MGFEEERNENIWLQERMLLEADDRDDVKLEEEEGDGISNLLHLESGSAE